MSRPDGYGPGFGPPRPRPAPCPPPEWPPSIPPAPSRPLKSPSPPYAAQASNQGYQQQQQPTSGSSGPVVVVALQYCLPHAVSLAVTKKVLPSGGGGWTISDPAGNILFTVDGKVQAVGKRRHLHLLNAAGYKDIHMERQRKFSRVQDVWHMYAGDSEQLICTVKKSSKLQEGPCTDVFLASNTLESMPDFTLEGNFFERNLKILHGEQAIAEVTPQTNPLIDEDTFGVTVFPGSDYAFVIALLVVMDANLPPQ